jgi:hypothetical protein
MMGEVGDSLIFIVTSFIDNIGIFSGHFFESNFAAIPTITEHFI